MNKFKKSFFEKTTKLAVVFFVVFFITIIWNPYSIFSGFRNVLFTITYPIQETLSISANKIFYFTETISHIGSLKKENEDLIIKNTYLTAENAKLKDALRENEILRKEIGLLPKKKFNTTTAYIIGKNLYGNNGWLLINKGSIDGIKKDMPIIVSGNVLVGKVSEVFLHNSKVKVVSNSDISISATTAETGAMGIVGSKYGLGTVLDMVAQTDYLKKGDSVITSEISQNIPQGLLIGKIQEIYPSNDRLFKMATLSMPIDLQKLRVVFVIISKK